MSASSLVHNVGMLTAVELSTATIRLIQPAALVLPAAAHGASNLVALRRVANFRVVNFGLGFPIVRQPANFLSRYNWWSLWVLQILLVDIACIGKLEVFYFLIVLIFLALS